MIDKLIGDEGNVPYCEICKRPFFDVFSTCVIVLLLNEYGEAALLRQNYISSHYHNLISGYMKPGECAEETARREVKEEIGIDLATLQIAGTYWFAKKELLMIGFFAFAPKKDFLLSSEVDHACWIPVRDALHMVHPKGTRCATCIIQIA